MCCLTWDVMVAQTWLCYHCSFSMWVESMLAGSLQILWAAMRDNQQTRSEVDSVRLENAALARELERVHGSLKDLGLEYRAAVEAAEASHV